MDILTPVLKEYVQTHERERNIFFNYAEKLLETNVSFDDADCKDARKALSKMKVGGKGYLMYLYQLIYYSAKAIEKTSVKEDKEYYTTMGTKFKLYNESTDQRFYDLQKMYRSLYNFITETPSLHDPFLKKI